MSRIFDYSKICDGIRNLDPLIRFAGVINPRGRLVAGGMKEGIEPLESQKDDEMLFMELALRVKMRQEFDKQLGKVKFAMSLREKVLAISVPIGDDVLYVAAESKADYKVLPEKILNIINKV
ncbi:MAG: hypothetical protein FJ360_00540 [Thaumarchaeota archaeon]|nr:hypothetical protein [Nitrososphaerota archaeon]